MKYAVVDLEMCKVSKGARTKEYKWANETIQIGAALVDENFEIIDTFNSYVKPEYGKLDLFISNLTGIEDADLYNAPRFGEAIEAFDKWLPDDVRCVSWSRTDEQQIRHELMGKHVESKKLENLLASWIDCQETFDNKVERNKQVSLEEAWVLADIEQSGKMHDGLDDAINTAKLFVKMEKNPEFEFNPLYEEAKNEESKPLLINMADLFAGVRLAIG